MKQMLPMKRQSKQRKMQRVKRKIGKRRRTKVMTKVTTKVTTKATTKATTKVMTKAMTQQPKIFMTLLKTNGIISVTRQITSTTSMRFGSLKTCGSWESST